MAEWEKYFSSIRRSTLLQSYDYARAICQLHHQQARWGLIKIDEKDAGLVQIIEASFLKGLFHALILDRGPLWFDGFGRDEDIKAFFHTFNKTFPRRMGRKRRIIPERGKNEALDHKYICHNEIKPYKTIWLDLTDNTDTIRSGFKKKWRNALSKSEKSDLTVRWDEKGERLTPFLVYYVTDRTDKGYNGPSANLLKEFARTFIPGNRFIIGEALSDGKVVGAILILIHGKSATYQVGWNTKEGRRLQAHNFLLWHAILHLKEKGITDFDLGGLNDEDAKNIKKFKEGMGGETVTLLGQFS